MKHLFFLLFLFPSVFSLSGQDQSRRIMIHLRGVSSSDMSLLPLSGRDAYKAIAIQKNIPDGGTGQMTIPPDYLPGEFVLRFDYKEFDDSTPYPAEKQVILSGEDLELWVHPIYSNDPDSTWFQPGEKENAIFRAFNTENAARRKALGLLQEFQLNYDSPKSRFYKMGVKEYEKRRKNYNQWISAQVANNRNYFVSNLMLFEFMPRIDFRGSEAERKNNLRDGYLAQMDFSNPLMIRTSRMKSWMDGYVNLWAEQIQSPELVDSIFSLAAKTAIEKAKTGDPVVYGWMVDYFFRGFEQNAMEECVKMLTPYLEDPKCMTEKRMAIEKRLKGMETLKPGTIVPDFEYADTLGNLLQFHDYQSPAPFKLVVFWSANCGHCKELVAKLHPWSQENGRQGKLQVFAISVDEGESEIATWESAISKLPGWTHVLAEGGVNSQAANDYFILSTPVMVLVNSRTNEIITLPGTLEQVAAGMQ